MKEPLWISADEALAINRMLVAQFGGLDAGVRDENLLQAALARPLNKWHYDEPKPDVFALAAAYAFGVAKGHVFHDGNKRAAFYATFATLWLNGWRLDVAEQDAAAMVERVAADEVEEDEFARWLESGCLRR